MSELTHKDLEWFRLANSAPSREFYAFKDRFLRRFAVEDGYDLQELPQMCWNCEGSGKFSKTHDCHKCSGSGVYAVHHVPLQRWNLHGTIYHKPVQWHECPLLGIHDDRFKNEIQGRIVHPGVSQRTAQRCYLRLLLRHEPVVFYWQMLQWVKDGLSIWRCRMRFRLWKIRAAADLFLPKREPVIFPFDL